MKVKRIVIEGDLPASCYKCDYKTYDVVVEGYVCLARSANRPMVIADVNIVDDRCPLEKYCEICEGYGVVVHASKGIIPCPECQKGSEDK